MNSELEKIDLLRARLGVSYQEAKEALDEAEGDVVQALIKLEQKGLHLGEKLHGRSKEAVSQLKNILETGQKTRIKIKKDGRTIMDLPATAGVVGLMGALCSTELAVIGAVGTIAAMANDYTMEIEHGDKEGNAANYRYRFPSKY